jgi:peroxiredoxin/outer membrane lipoprotein-sorting protein
MRSRLIGLVLVAPCLTFAAGSATEILQHVAAVYRDLRSYGVRVTAQTVRGSDVSERHFAETGAGPGKYRVEFDNAHGELRVGDGQVEWLYRPDTDQYSKTPLAAADGTHIGALAEIDRHVRETSIAREEEFLVNGKPVPIYVVNVVRDQWPRGSIEGAEHTMYRIDRESFVVYKAITYSPKATEILLYSIAKWNQPLPEALFRFEPPASARAASPASLPAQSKPLVGAVAPDFTLPDTGGNTVHLRELQGKVIIVDFWATWCPPCRALMPRLQKMYVNWEKRGLVVLGLDVGEDANTVEKFAREQSYTFPLLIGTEPDIAAKYFVEAYPSTFVIDRLGRIVFRDLGGADPAKLQAAVEKALGGH